MYLIARLSLAVQRVRGWNPQFECCPVAANLQLGSTYTRLAAADTVECMRKRDSPRQHMQGDNAAAAAAATAAVVDTAAAAAAAAADSSSDASSLLDRDSN